MMGVYCYFVLVDFKAKKTQFVLLDWSSNNVAIGVKMYVFVLEEKSSFKMLGLCFSSNLDRGSSIVSITKTCSKKMGGLIHSFKFLSLEFTL